LVVAYPQIKKIIKIKFDFCVPPTRCWRTPQEYMFPRLKATGLDVYIDRRFSTGVLHKIECLYFLNWFYWIDQSNVICRNLYWHVIKKC
jgi:hypothetical protein